MSNEPAQRLAQLPGLDTAPDVYETPDIDDSTTTSTIQTSPREGPSETSETSDEEDEGVSRRRLYPERARSRFGAQARGVQTDGTDWSDRVDGRRRGYRIGKGRSGDGGKEEEEGLQARIARLKREVEECRALAQEEDDDEGEDEEREGEVVEDIDALSRLLAGIDMPAAKRKDGARRQQQQQQVFHDALPTATPADDEADGEIDEHTLSRISAFDGRLAALETALGVSSILDPSSDTDTLSTPLIPSLTLLDQQLSTLTSATSPSSLEAVSSRIAKLKLEAQQLSDLHHAASAAAAATTTSDTEEAEDEPSTPSAATAAAHLLPEDAKHLASLYTLLPTLQSLSPLVPTLLTRLRSLRTLHSSAASAAADLDALEQRQTEMERELKMWREGLEKVEHAVQEANSANGRNGQFVKDWVDDLEGRVKALGR